jgi:hypothetical protein
MIQAKDKKLIQDLIAVNETERAIQEFRSALEKANPKGGWMTDLLSISARFSHLTEEVSRGVIFKDDEDVLRNRIHVDLGNLLERASRAAEEKVPVETPATKATANKKKPRPSPSTPIPVTTDTPVLKPGKSSGTSNWTGWLLMLGAGVVGYFLIFGWPGNQVGLNNLKICTLNARDRDYCCMQDEPLIPFRSSGGFYVSLNLSKELRDPLVTGHVYAKDGLLMDTAPIQLTQDAASGSNCYSGLISMPPGVSWNPGNYMLEIHVNQKLAGEKEFSISF